MTLPEKLRAYLAEPLIAAFVLSIVLNFLGNAQLADFMHAEAHDLLSLLTVLLAACLGLWVGLFWVSNTAFGRWLAEKSCLEDINGAYITSVLVLLSSCIVMIFCAYLDKNHVRIQALGAFICIYALATIPTALSNTYKLLKLHGAFGRQESKVAEMRRTNTR